MVVDWAFAWSPTAISWVLELLSWHTTGWKTITTLTYLVHINHLIHFSKKKETQVAISLNLDINLSVSFTTGTRTAHLFRIHRGDFGKVYGSWRFRARLSNFSRRLAQTRCLLRIIYGSVKFLRKRSALAVLVFRSLLSMLYGVVTASKLSGIRILDEWIEVQRPLIPSRMYCKKSESNQP